MKTQQKRAATALAYGLMVGLVAIVSLGAITSSGSAVTGLFGTTADTLVGIAPSPDPSASPIPSPVLGPATATVNQAVEGAVCSTVQLTNSGPGGPANINVSVSGDYTMTGCTASNCQGASMGGPANCNIHIKGTASVAGPISGAIDITADDGISHSIAVSGTAYAGGYVSTDLGTGNTFHVVQVPYNTTLSDPASYHALCQVYGLSAWDTTDTNSACQNDLGNYPQRVITCNMGHFNYSTLDYKFDVNVPSLSRVYWIAVNYGNVLGLEYNGVGPCNAGEQIGACGTGSVSGSGNGIRHSKNPAYSSNYDVRNASLSTSHYILCANP